MKKIALLALITVILTFTSCDNFFSNSWGKQRSYDSKNIDVNADNVDEWIEAAKGNPELADAVTEAIINELEKMGNTDNPEAAKLFEGGVNLAVESSGLGESILTEGAKLLGDIDDFDEDTFTDLLGKIQDDFNSGGGPGAAEKIGKLVDTVVEDKDGAPKFNDTYTEMAEPGDIVETILVLIMGELYDMGISIDDIDSWSSLEEIADGRLMLEVGPPPEIQVGPEASLTDVALAAYLNLIAENHDKYDNPMIYTIWEGFFNK